LCSLKFVGELDGLLLGLGGDGDFIPADGDLVLGGDGIQ